MATPKQSKPNKSYKILNDAIHGAIKLDQIYWHIIDTKQFQRLRNIHQLGPTHYVFPSATHTRFEHSIGVCHLAEKLARKLQAQLKEDKAEIQILDSEVKCVAIAGLCHDLGHGPFSHLWQEYLNEKKKPSENKWKHENESIRTFKEICDDINEEKLHFTSLEKLLIASFILPPKKDELESYFKNLKKTLGITKQNLKEDDNVMTVEDKFQLKPFLWGIVNNERSKIDVDKWDYFQRDCHYLGKANSFDDDRLMQFIRVVRDEKNKQWVLAYRDIEALSIYHMFHMRWYYHHRYYQHPKKNVIDKMLKDAFDKAGLNDEENSQYNDYEIIEKLKSKKESKEIMDRIEKRDLYCNMNTASRIVYAKDIESKKAELDKEIREKYEVEKYIKTPETKAADFYIQVDSFDYGAKDEDPFCNIPFYSNREPCKLKTSATHLPVMRPVCFQEHKISCVIKNKQDKALLRKVFEEKIEEFSKKQKIELKDQLKN